MRAYLKKFEFFTKFLTLSRRKYTYFWKGKALRTISGRIDYRPWKWISMGLFVCSLQLVTFLLGSLHVCDFLLTRKGKVRMEDGRWKEHKKKDEEYTVKVVTGLRGPVFKSY